MLGSQVRNDGEELLITLGNSAGSLRAASAQQSYAEAHASLGQSVEHARDSSCFMTSSGVKIRLPSLSAAQTRSCRRP